MSGACNRFYIRVLSFLLMCVCYIVHGQFCIFNASLSFLWLRKLCFTGIMCVKIDRMSLPIRLGQMCKLDFPPLAYVYSFY